MKDINFFCFGFGHVAKSFIKKIISKKFKINLSTTSRHQTGEFKFNDIKFSNFHFNGDQFDSDLIENLKKMDHILISIPPINGQDIVVKNFSNILIENKPKWITYLSATSVYGDHKGEWVNEQSQTFPKSENGIDRLKAENSWISLYKKKNLPIQIFRLAGIYSEKNNILERLKLGNANIIHKKNHFFSRIHIDDISNILSKSLDNFKAGEIFNISDDKPSSSEEVTLYGARILNLPNPKEIQIEDIESKMLRSFYNDSKKVNNKKMKKFFNYELRFPTYVEGLNYIKKNLV